MAELHLLEPAEAPIQLNKLKYWGGFLLLEIRQFVVHHQTPGRYVNLHIVPMPNTLAYLAILPRSSLPQARVELLTPMFSVDLRSLGVNVSQCQRKPNMDLGS